uniref:Tub domain-containing protein n=1 Tax=Caenorhabditis tropicalis TaxID=1561998 RepID=A0A1I7T921_9PELO
MSTTSGGSDDTIWLKHRVYLKGILVSGQNKENQRPLRKPRPRAPNPWPPSPPPSKVAPPPTVNGIKKPPEWIVDDMELKMREVTRSLLLQKTTADYPFVVDGIIRNPHHNGKLLTVISSRMGKIKIPDQRDSHERMADYVHFIVMEPGVYKGFLFSTRPPHLLSFNFPSIHGTALLTSSGGLTMCWNESLGLMPVFKGAKKTSESLEIVSFHANYEDGRFYVTRVDAIGGEDFQTNAFLVNDPIILSQNSEDVEVFSKSKNCIIHVEKRLMKGKRIEEMVVVPTFPTPTRIVYSAILILDSTFWNSKNQRIKKILKSN